MIKVKTNTYLYLMQRFLRLGVFFNAGQVPMEDMMRKLVFAVMTAAPILATLPVAAHADPFGPRPHVEHGDRFGPPRGDQFRHRGWEHGHHYGWQQHPWRFKRHRFEHDYGWYRGPHRGW